ncbi:MAG TPA: class II fructose-bisphosphate aldolase [Candidatus Saccharimonadales bacterium]|nr:class II fructose-bisphosphate aldolase [Candidatus Saccharimonadales bacterium]
MGLTIQQIRDNTIRARHLMQRSRSQKFAVGAFNIDNQETLIAVSRAAQKLNAPVLVEVSDGEVKAIGLENIRDMVDNYREEYGIEMYINLDHSPSVEAAKRGIDAGFEFIHIDISQANHDASRGEIIAKTKEIVEYAKFTGALVEAEERYFMGSSNVHTETIDYEEVKKYNTKPDEAVDFVNQTGIDTLAVQIGNLHGLYPVPKQLDLELLQQIRDVIQCQISLHGGSGTPLHYFEDAAKIGVSKININSDMRYAFRKTLEKVLADHPDEYAVVKLMPEVYEAVQKVVEEKISAFGSAGKAVL